jgi:hypothetical protein
MARTAISAPASLSARAFAANCIVVLLCQQEQTLVLGADWLSEGSINLDRRFRRSVAFELLRQRLISA